MTQLSDISISPPRNVRPRLWANVVVSIFIFFPAIIVTLNFQVFKSFVIWVRSINVFYFDEIASMLILCGLPSMTYLSYRLFQLNRALRFDEETIRGLHRRNESLLHAAGDGIFGLNGSGRITFINISAARMLGASVATLMGGHVRDILGLSQGVAETDPSPLEKTLADGQSYVSAQDLFFRSDGTSFPVEYTSTPLHQEDEGAGAVVTFRDVSGRLRTEAELNRLAAAVNQTAEMIVITDAAGCILYVNPAFEKSTGYGREDVLGVNVVKLPDAVQGKQWGEKLSQAISQGLPFKRRFLAHRKDGQLFHADIILSPVRDQDGRIASHVIVGRDVTNEMELGRQLRKSQRLEAVGTLAGGIAHDFNNILTAILSYTELTMDELEPESLDYRNLNEVMDAANRAKELVKQLLTYSGRSERERVPLSLSPEIAGAVSLLMAVLPDKITVETSYPEMEGRVLADPTRIHQVVMNLCTNAVEAMEKNGGILSLSLENVQVDQCRIDHDAALSGLQAGPHMVLMVKDRGIGIPAAHLERLFEPFFTTKSVGKGSGLGLSVVHGIVQSHEGAIKVESVEGQGATFQVFLPVLPDLEDGSGGSSIGRGA